MALIRNGGNLYPNTNRYFGAVGVVALGSALDGGAAKRNWQNGTHRVTDVTDKSGLPNGYRHPVAWLMPQKAGAIASRRQAILSITGQAEGALGLNGVASTVITISGTAVGGLVAGGVATATITLSGTASAFAALGGVANATITLDGAAVASAIAHGAANGTITVGGTVVPYAIGHMGPASSDFGGELTPEGIAAAVWQALKASFTDPDTMGGALNTAGSGGIPPEIVAQIKDLWQRFGLDPANPMTTSDTQITAGDVDIEMVEGPADTIVSTRQ